MAERVAVAKCQQRLATLWLIAAGAIVLLVVAQSIGGIYGGRVGEAWSWLLPLVSPLLLLIVGAVVAEAKRPQSTATVDRFAYRMSLGLSAFYLVLVPATILLQPFSGRTPLEMLDLSNLWLGPLQGFVAMALGVFFQSKET
jgi:hypothetical protein